MRIKILFEIVDGASGGGNQFLKLLRQELIRMNQYTDDEEYADCYIFNSHHNIDEVIRLKRKYPKKLFVHRVDGPIFLLRDRDIEVDQLVFKANEYLSDITVFQTKWSREKCKNLGMKIGENTVIINGTNTSVFHPNPHHVEREVQHPVFIASSWSNNINKGYDFYKYIDENADFSRFDFVFYGNSPYKFRNIKTFSPVGGNELANRLREVDYYISASKNDCCSNAIVEALASGLPVLALNSGGNPELLKDSGSLFSTKEELLGIIEAITEKKAVIKKTSEDFSIQKVANEYTQFIQDYYDTANRNRFNISRLIKAKIVFYFLTYKTKLIHRIGR